jgi:hypothetical protein
MPPVKPIFIIDQISETKLQIKIKSSFKNEDLIFAINFLA